jgi:hypothetical protein
MGAARRLNWRPWGRMDTIMGMTTMAMPTSVMRS